MFLYLCRGQLSSVEYILPCATTVPTTHPPNDTSIGLGKTDQKLTLLVQIKLRCDTDHKVGLLRGSFSSDSAHDDSSFSDRSSRSKYAGDPTGEIQLKTCVTSSTGRSSSDVPARSMYLSPASRVAKVGSVTSVMGSSIAGKGARVLIVAPRIDCRRCRLGRRQKVMFEACAREE